jgi:threonine dehydrogenase-like Zn-dependent dehydrogenase
MRESPVLRANRATPVDAGRRRIRSLGIERPGCARFFELEDEPLEPGRIRVDTIYTGLSAGTELTFFKGTNPYLHAAWQPELGVFRRDRPATGYPVRTLGYMEVARVLASRSKAHAPGDLVAMAYGHRSGHTADPGRQLVVPLPADLDPILGVYAAHMGPICANGLLHAAADVRGTDVRDLGDGVAGRCVLVTGGGVIGLLVGLFARHLGAAEVAVADRTPARLRAAAALGLEPVDESVVEPWREVKERWRHGSRDRGADVAFQCRGRVASLVTALRALRPQGSVIDLAFYQESAAELRLGEEFHHNGLAIRCAQITRVPRQLAGSWDRRRLAAETIALLRAEGDAIREHLITDVLPLEEAPALLEAISARRRHVIQAVFEVGRPDRRPGR